MTYYGVHAFIFPVFRLFIFIEELQLAFMFGYMLITTDIIRTA
jgi:hypothetical protein